MECTQPTFYHHCTQLLPWGPCPSLVHPDLHTLSKILKPSPLMWVPRNWLTAVVQHLANKGSETWGSIRKLIGRLIDGQTLVPNWFPVLPMFATLNTALLPTWFLSMTPRNFPRSSPTTSCHQLPASLFPLWERKASWRRGIYMHPQRVSRSGTGREGEGKEFLRGKETSRCQ